MKKKKKFNLIIEIDRPNGQFILNAFGDASVDKSAFNLSFSSDLFATTKKGNEICADLDFHMEHHERIGAVVRNSIFVLLDHGRRHVVPWKGKKKKK